MRRFLRPLVASLVFASSLALADGPPTSNGVISNPTLVKNQDVAKAQAAGAIMSFMSQGSKTCDADGKNCTSVFGADDTPDYTRLQLSSQALTGVSAFSFMDDDGTGGAGNARSISSQMGTLALACGDYSVKKVAGIAIKLTNCAVTASGDAQITVQVCSAPMRGNPIKPPENEVVCSDDPAAPNFRAPVGFVCKRPACDTQEVGSLDGWSVPQTISFQANLPTAATDEQKSKNGLGLIFYPPLTGGTVASFTADSDNMTAVKIVQTFVNNETRRTAVGIKFAYRHKTQVTKEMMVQGASSVPNPGANTAQWDTVLKLQGNAMIPQYQQKYGANGSECLQQITNGLATDGVVAVCDQNYTNESGIKPLAKTAQMAVEGQDCGTTPQCLRQVVNTTTWQESCQAEVPLALRSCTTTQDYAMEDISYTRTRTQEVCHESRVTAEYSCQTRSVVSGVVPKSCPAGTVLVDKFGPNACPQCSDNYQKYKLTCEQNNQVRVRWYTAYSNGADAYKIVDKTVVAKAFENSYAELGPFCQDGSGTVPFQVACSATACTYTTWITGNCNGATMKFRETGSAGINYEGEYMTVNECTEYEAAR